ncbi:kinase-like protein [Neocallimastix californiae]|uniref:Kinase-like protein n=1 Tax=Neocallimastix californiae TaxID=1754190 RepID=A0A1Y2ANM9_9FUNG|nr:kinase-like protein [Neocallimastix californiae]|eukprot:ORY24169.1 kinase-like protein [Neocallimastix californiae]
MQKYWPEKRCHGKENIWFALNQMTQEKVVLKYFPMSTFDDYVVSREAYTMKYLHNEDPKHFLEMYDYMEDNNEDQYMIAMEKAECSLEDIINERGHISEEQAIPILREILTALQVMHKNNFIHRDLKLSNILLSSKDDLTSIKIIDFGETVERNDDYHISGIVGTLHYMAPEILKKKKYGKAVDIWAFGVIAYRLLTGYFPYITEGENHSKQLKAILNNNVSYLCTDDSRLSIKVLEPNDRMGIQTALEHPFLNPQFEGEFIPYKPIPKFSKKMSKENMKEGKSMNMKSN